MNAPIAPPKLMTAEEFLALPDDGVERWLSRGRLREIGSGGKTMTVRNRRHSAVESNVVYLLKHWLRQQSHPRGRIHSGEVGCYLTRDPDTLVGIDVAYISAELAAQDPDSTTLIDGIPILAVEILSPHDTHENIQDKVDDYLAANVPLVWIVDPHRRTVTVFRPDAEPELFNVQQELSGEPHLPGFKVRITEIFED